MIKAHFFFTCSHLSIPYGLKYTSLTAITITALIIYMKYFFFFPAILFFIYVWITTRNHARIHKFTKAVSPEEWNEDEKKMRKCWEKEDERRERSSFYLFPLNKFSQCKKKRKRKEKKAGRTKRRWWHWGNKKTVAHRKEVENHGLLSDSHIHLKNWTLLVHFVQIKFHRSDSGIVCILAWALGVCPEMGERANGCECVCAFRHWKIGNGERHEWANMVTCNSARVSTSRHNSVPQYVIKKKRRKRRAYENGFYYYELRHNILRNATQ